MQPGDCARVVGLVNDTALNGAACEVLTAPAVNAVPEYDGVIRKRLRCGVQLFPTGRTGFVPVEHLERLGGPETVRAHCIRYFGTETWPEARPVKGG